jgi:glycosyltransferase involved in cell wall biosynthesis
MEAPHPFALRMLYLSCARIPSEKAHTYQILKMCEAFSRQGMKVTLLYQRRNNKQLEARAGDIFTYYALRTPFTLKRLLCLDSALLERIHAGLWFYVLTATYLCAAALYVLRHRKAIDIIYCRDIFSLALLGVLRPVLRRPIFYEAHVFPRTLTRFHVRCLKKMDGIVTLTGQLRARLVEHGVHQVPINVAHDGVDLHRFSNAQRTAAHIRARMEMPDESILIGYVGRFVTMEQEKGIKDLLAALCYLPEYQSVVYMAFVGGPMNHVPAYYQIIDELHLDRHHFRFYDLVPVNDVAAYLAACDIVAMPFPWTPHYAYHMSPLKMFEYMAAEKPILATRLPSIMEVLTDGENAVLVEPDSPEALAQGIRRIIEDKTFSQHISKRARQDVLHYTWERRAQKIAQFIMDNLPSDAPPETSRECLSTNDIYRADRQ